MSKTAGTPVMTEHLSDPVPRHLDVNAPDVIAPGVIAPDMITPDMITRT